MNNISGLLTSTFKFSVLLVCLLMTASCSPATILGSAATVTAAASVREGGLSASLSDARITAQISDLWFKYDVETFRKLDLTVNQGRVLITGIVQDPENRVEAVRLAWQVKGVKQVINEIKIDESEGIKGFIRDNWITTRLRAAMTFDSQVQNLNYSIETVQGVVYLMGVAQNQIELNRLLDIARSIPHVKQVISYVKLAGENISGEAVM